MNMKNINAGFLSAAMLLACTGAQLAWAGEDEEGEVELEAGLALKRTADDAKLQWHPCPDFFPQGCGIAFLHGDPAKNNLDVFFRLQGGAKFPSHWHTSAERMVLVSGELHVTYEGQSETVLSPGDYAYGPAGLKHHGYCAEGDDCVLFIAFEQPLDAMPSDTAPADVTNP